MGEIERGIFQVVLAAGMDGHIYRQLLREMSPESDWQLLVEGPSMRNRTQH